MFICCYDVENEKKKKEKERKRHEVCSKLHPRYSWGEAPTERRFERQLEDVYRLPTPNCP